MLDAAGYPRGADGIRFKTKLNLATWFDFTYGEAASSYWRDIGVDVEIVGHDGATYGAIVGAHTYEGMIMTNGAYPLAPRQTTSWAHSTNNQGQNAAGWQDPELDAMVEAALAEDNPEEQMRLITAVDYYKIENRWFVYGTLVPTYYANWPWLKGYNGEGGMGNPGVLGSHLLPPLA